MKKQLSALCVVLAAAGLLWIGNQWLGMREEHFFTAALQQAQLPVPATQGERRLAYAKALAQHNPLLALPGTSANALNKNVSELQELEQQLYALNADSPKARLVYSLYPTTFLHALANLEQARQNFITKGGRIEEAAYNTAAQKAFAAYRSDAQDFKQAFDNAVPTSSGKFATDGDIVSRAGILLAVDTFMQSMRQTNAAFSARVQCTRGNIQQCNASDLQTPTVPVTPEVSVTPMELAQAKAVRALSAKAHSQPLLAQGPMLLLPSTECAKNMGGAALFEFYTPASLGVLREPFPLYLGNIRFDDSNASSSPAFARFTTAMKQKITYILDSPMLHYSCIESAHDAGKLFAMQDIYDFAQAHKLSALATSSSAKASLGTLEQKNLDVLTQHQVEQYLVAAGTLMLPAETQHNVRELTLAYMFTSAHFENTIGEILADETSNVALVKKGWPIALDVPYMFFIRSSFWALLQAENRSAIQPSTKAGGIQKPFPPNTIAMEKQPFIYYSELPSTYSMKQKLIHDIDFFYHVHIHPDLIDGLVQK